jgi:RNA polymerase sigma factor (sigma-70 family)
MSTTQVLDRRSRERNGLPVQGYCAYSDEELLREYMACDSREAFRVIQARHGAMVFRTCLRFLGSTQDAEDAAQTVFLLLSRQPGGARGSVGGWLHTAARNTAIQMLRSRAARSRREQVVAQRKADLTQAHARLRDKLDTALGLLPKPLQEAVILCYLEGREQQEAAVLLGCHQGTLSRRAQQGLVQLRSILNHEGAACSVQGLLGLMAYESAAGVPAAWSASGTGGVSGGVPWICSLIAKVLFWIKTKTWAMALGGACVAAAVAIPMIANQRETEPGIASTQRDRAPSFDHMARWKDVPSAFQTALARAWPSDYVPEAVSNHTAPGRETEWHVVGRKQDGSARRVVARMDKTGTIQTEIRQGHWQGTPRAKLPQP